MNAVIVKVLPEVQALCERYHVARLYLFGSAAGNRFAPDSDIDLVVAFRSAEIADYADNYFALRESLESVFSRKVDLVSERTIRNPYFQEAVEKSKVLLYHEPEAA